MECKICQRKCNGALGLSQHILKEHHIPTKEYYDKYLRKQDEGVCVSCKKEVKFYTLSTGYKCKFCSPECFRLAGAERAKKTEAIRLQSISKDNAVVCKICQKICNGNQGLGLHLNKEHNVIPQQYYDQYLQKQDEGICANCGLVVPFASLGRGYEGKYCSQTCMFLGFKQKEEKERKEQQETIPDVEAFVCLICNMKFTRLSGLGTHLHHTHNMESKNYYDRFLKKDPQEGVCLECGKPTFFQDLGAGYPNKYCSMSCNKAEAKRQRLLKEVTKQEVRKIDWIACRICNQRVTGFEGLSTHVNKAHGVSAQQYYDAFMRKIDEGFCLECKKPTNFESLNKGYFDHCSIQCNNQSEKFRAMMSKVSSRVPGRLKGWPSPRKGTTLSFEHTKNIRISAMKRAEEHCRLFGHKFPTRGNKEIPFMNELQEISPYQIDIDFRPCGYILDGYIHELNLGIEFDEQHHESQIQRELDRKREENIQKEVPNIKFFRVKQQQWEIEPADVLKQFVQLVYTEDEAN